jgi:hypothetical protein
VSVDRNGADIANAEFSVVTTPALHILADVEPDDGDPFECALPGMTHSTSFAAGTVIPPLDTLYAPMNKTGDGDAWCFRLYVTADHLPGLDLPRDFVLLQEDLAMPYGGTKHLHRDQKLFEVRVCKMLSKAVPALAFLGDHCRIDVVGTADADLLVNGSGEGFRSQGALEVRTITNGVASQTILPAQNVHFASASSIFSSFAIPCNAVAGSQVTYRLQNNTYKARVNSVMVGVKLEFYAVGVHISPLDVSLGQLDLLNGTTLNVSATAANVFTTLGYMTSSSAAACSSSGTPSLRPYFSGVLPTLYRDETQHWFVKVFNDGSAPTSGQYSITVTIPSGYTMVQVANDGGWACSQ